MPRDNESLNSTPDGHEPGRDHLAAARGSDLVVIRVVGHGNMLLAPALQEFAEAQIRAGFKRFVFDLERCRSLDSTFMGVMVGIHLAVKSAAEQRLEALSPDEAANQLKTMFKKETRPAEKTEASRLGETAENSEEAATARTVSAVNASPEVIKLLSMLGVDRFVKMHGSCDLAPLETTILPEKNLSPSMRHRLILEAHENLVEIDKRNEAQFGPLLKSLSKALEE